MARPPPAEAMGSTALAGGWLPKVYVDIEETYPTSATLSLLRLSWDRRFPGH